MTRARPIRSLLLRNFCAIVAIAALLTYVIVYAWPLAEAPIRSDGYSYYVYLPSWWIYHDVTLDTVARDCCGGAFPDFTAVSRWPQTGRWVDAHPIGVAILTFPFFLAADALTRWSNLPRDGFSLYYQHGAGLAGLAYFIAGLWVLRSLLSRHFTDAVTLVTLVAVTFGTNLFHYGVYDSTFSHAFSFALIAALLWLTDRWWETPTWRVSIALGAVAGLIVLARHLNVLFLLVVPLYGVVHPRDASQRLLDLWRRRASIAAIAMVGAICLLPQLVIYKKATGRYLVSSYGSRGFTFSSPHLYGVLLSVQKGLFFWSPVLLLAIAGMCVACGWATRWLVATIVILAAETYLIASWFDWQFGASFGHRGFVDALPVLALFMAAFLDWASARPRLQPAIGVALTIAVLLSVAQMIQYWSGILPIADTTWDQYKQVFLRFR
jgi:hypothetical protein